MFVVSDMCRSAAAEEVFRASVFVTCRSPLYRKCVKAYYFDTILENHRKMQKQEEEPRIEHGLKEENRRWTRINAEEERLNAETTEKIDIVEI